MEPVVALDSRVLGEHARRAVAALADHEWVVLVRRDMDVTYHAVPAGVVRTVAEDVTIGESIEPWQGIGVPAWRLDGEAPEPQGPVVLVGPDGVLGTLGFDRLGAVGAEPERTASPPDAATPGGTPGDTLRSYEPLPPAPSPVPPTAPPPAAAPPGGTGDLVTYPRVAAPDQVAAGTAFDLEIGFGDDPLEGARSGPIRLLAVEETFDLEIQVMAPDFEMPAGGRRFLHVRRSDPTAARVTVPLVAPRPTEARRHTVRVGYVHRGVPVGEAWREVIVTPTQARVEATVESGGAAVAVSDPGGWADLTVIVSEGQRPDELTWSFFTRHDVSIPDQATRSLDAADAEAFAHEQVLRLGKSAGSDLELTELTGVSRIVADVMPPEFWEALAAVAGAGTAAADGGRPSVFLVTADPWVPWELASTEPDYLPPELLDPAAPSFLGAQFRVARWLEQKRYGRFNRPDHPPVSEHRVSTLCLVIGDYLAEHGQRPLPAAIEEGKELAARYPHVWRAATSADLDEVLDDRIREKGDDVAVDVLHLACHGRLTDDVWASGIVLAGDQRTLSPTTVRGSTLTQSRRPFVFLNACQVGQATTVPGGYGGMAGAFVREGASGFVAPLWEVGDVLAKQSALDLYRDTLEEGLEVAEAMRRFRAAFTEGQSTRLAYVYYGHPRLRLVRA